MDSKKLSEVKREYLFDAIIQAERTWMLCFGVGMSDAEVIDRVGIREANRLAMAAAITELHAKLGVMTELAPLTMKITPEIPQTFSYKIDGRDNYRFDGIPNEHLEFIVRGDSKVHEIMTASIVAKVSRDRWMRMYEEAHPAYQFNVHKGYGTALHAGYIEAKWAGPIHRLTFAPMKNLR